MLISYLIKNKQRILLVLFAVIGMGFSLSFLIRTDLGGNPFTCMNLAISLPAEFAFFSADTSDRSLFLFPCS